MKGYKESDYVDEDGSYTDKGLWLAAKGMGLVISILKCDTATDHRPMMYNPLAQELTDFTRHLQKMKEVQTELDNIWSDGSAPSAPSAPSVRHRQQEFFAIESNGHWTLLAATHQPNGKLEYSYINSKNNGTEQGDYSSAVDNLDNTSPEFLKAMKVVYGEENVIHKQILHDVQQGDDNSCAIHVILNACVLRDGGDELGGQDHSVENIQNLDAYYKGMFQGDHSSFVQRRKKFAAQLKGEYGKLSDEIKDKIVVGYLQDNHTKEEDEVVNYINSDDKKPAQELDIPALMKLSKHMMARELDQQIAGMSQEEAQQWDANLSWAAHMIRDANHIPEPTAYSGLGLEAEFVDGNGVKGFKVTAIKEGADEKLNALVGKTITHYTVDGVKYPITSEEDYVHIRNAAF